MSLAVDIEKKLHSFTLRIKFEVDKGILALLGASGCGKSMTLKCIAGIETPDKGKISLDGEILFDSEKHINLSPQKRRVGYLFQNYALFGHMTVEQNICAGMGKMSRAEKHIEAIELISRFYLDGLEQQLPQRLSGGQQQRVALARILASKPRLLLLDEPFSALDTWLRWQLEQEISILLKQFSGVTLFVSHNRNEVYRLCNTVGVIADGKLQEVTEKNILFETPQTVEACLLTGCKNLSPIRIESHKSITAIDWGITFEIENVDNRINYIGIKSHLFTPVKNYTMLNTFAAVAESVVEDSSSMIVMLRAKNAPLNGRVGLIRWELSKELWKEWKNKELFLHVEQKNILLLE